MALHVGTAKVDITPKQPAWLQGYAGRDRPSERVLDALSLRALYARDGEGARALLLLAETTFVSQELDESIRGRLFDQLEWAPDDVMTLAIHSHSAPVTAGPKSNPEWLESVAGKALAAAALAEMRAKPVKGMELSRGVSRISVNRRQEMPDGSFGLGENRAKPVDQEFLLLRVIGEDDAILVQLLNYACHAVTFGQESYLVSAEWPGEVSRGMEGRDDAGGAHCLFTIGGCGDVNPLRACLGEEEGEEALAWTSGTFLDDVRQALESGAVRLPDEDVVRTAIRECRLPHKASVVEEGKGASRRTLLRAVRIGPLTLVGAPAEVFTETQLAVKEADIAPAAFVCAYCAGHHCGYVPTDEAYDEGCYEVTATRLGRGAEAILRGELIELGRSLRP